MREIAVRTEKYIKIKKMKIMVDKPLFLLYDIENVFWKTFS